MTTDPRGHLVKAGEKRHRCYTPGWRHRRRLGVKSGAIWKCSCGQHYRWTPGVMGSSWDIAYSL